MPVPPFLSQVKGKNEIRNHYMAKSPHKLCGRMKDIYHNPGIRNVSYYNVVWLLITEN